MLFVLSNLHEHRQQYDKAVEDYREIIAQEPQNFLVLNNLAIDLARTGGDLKKPSPM